MDTTRAIQDLLLNLGITPNLLGFDAATKAVEIYLNKKKQTGHAPKITEIYAEVARQLGCSEGVVERRIRHSVESMFDFSEPERIYSILGAPTNMKKGKYINGEFIALMALVARRRMEDRNMEARRNGGTSYTH